MEATCEFELSDDKVLQLIDLVRKHPFLYDKKSPAYRKAVSKDRAWSLIASILAAGISGQYNEMSRRNIV